MFRTTLAAVVLLSACSTASARPWIVGVAPVPVAAYYPPVAAYYPPVAAYYPPVVAYPPVYAPVVAPAVPVVTYYGAPAVATVPGYYVGPSPYYVGRPVVVSQRVYIPGQPVRNAFRVLAP